MLLLKAVQRVFHFPPCTLCRYFLSHAILWEKLMILLASSESWYHDYNNPAHLLLRETVAVKWPEANVNFKRLTHNCSYIIFLEPTQQWMRTFASQTSREERCDNGLSNFINNCRRNLMCAAHKSSTRILLQQRLQMISFYHNCCCGFGSCFRDVLSLFFIGK